MKYFECQEKVTHGSATFPFAYYYVNPLHERYDMTMHWHKECELIRILEGEFEANVQGCKYHLQEGDILFLNSGFIHSGTPSLNCVYECIVFDITSLLQRNPLGNEELNALIDFKREITAKFCRTDPNIAYHVLNHIFEIFTKQHKGYQLQIYGELYYFLGLVEEYKLYTRANQPTGPNSKIISKIKKIFSYIEQHYMEQINLIDLAKVLNMSEKYFCKFFKELTQKSPIDYLNWYRIQCACSKIKAASDTLTNIAYDCGFNDTSYFTKVFKKYSGYTPRDYARIYATMTPTQKIITFNAVTTASVLKGSVAASANAPL